VDPRAARNPERVANRTWLTAELTAVLAAETTDAWVSRLRAADVPCGPVNTIDRILDDPHVADLDLVTTFVRDSRETRVVGSPLRFSGTERRSPWPPPTLGEHTSAVLDEVLGLDPDEIEGLRASGVV
jgi:crotonobetainyl-CoA:carnitine CoA-transferase CaiB-like acyl-CoA transferase